MNTSISSCLENVCPAQRLTLAYLKGKGEERT